MKRAFYFHFYMHRTEKSHDFSSSIFQEAKDEYYRRHLGDFSEKPECLARSDFESENDGYTYELMWGPYEFFPFGSLETWDRTESLAKISVPTLLLAGEHDQVTGETLQPFMDSIPDVTCKVIPNASHVPHLENPSATFEVVNKFLLSHSS